MLTRGQDEAPAFESDVLHRRQPRVAIVGGWRTVELDALGVHRGTQQGHIVLPADDGAELPERRIEHRQRRAVATAPDDAFHGSRHHLPMLAEQRAVRREEQHCAVECAELALDNP